MKPKSRLLFSVIALAISSLQAKGQSVPAQPPPAPAAIDGEAQSQAGPASQEVHLLVGHSIVIRTDSRLKRVLVGNPAVLTTLTSSPNELVVTALAPGASSLLLWQENGQSRMIETFADVDVTDLRGALRRSLPNEPVDVEGDGDKVVLTGTVSSPAISDQIAKMALEFAKSTVNSLQIAPALRKKEILLKVRFAEVDRSRIENFGINILSTGAANTVGSTTTQQFGNIGLGQGGGLTGVIGGGNQGYSSTFSMSNLMNIFLFRPDLNLGAVIADLEQKNVLQVLAEPNLLAVSGSPAKFLAGGEIPYPVVTGGGAGTVGTVTIEFKPYGIKLEFTGDVENDGMIKLTVAPEVSSLDYSNAVTLSGFVMPAISTRRAETVVELKSGQSFGIAGLLDQSTTAQLGKVPGIANVPVLGLLFHSKSLNKSTNELMVFVTPLIVDPLNAGATPEVNPALPKMPLENGAPKNFDESLHKKGSK
jgi:pilus assembly protein CpaC